MMMIANNLIGITEGLKPPMQEVFWQYLPYSWSDLKKNNCTIEFSELLHVGKDR